MPLMTPPKPDARTATQLERNHHAYNAPRGVSACSSRRSDRYGVLSRKRASSARRGLRMDN